MSLSPRSDYWRLGLALIFMQLVIAAVLAVYGLYAVRSFHYETIETALHRLTPVFASRYEPLLRAGDTGEIARRVVSDARLANARLTVILPDGSVAGDSVTNPRTMDNHRYRPEIAAALTEGEGSAVRFSGSVGREMLYLARRVDDDGGTPLGVVRTSIAMARTTAGFAEFLRAVTLATIVSMAFTATLVFLMNRHFEGVVRGLASGVRQIARGDFKHRLQPPTDRGLHTMAICINTMAENVDARISEVEHRRHEEEAILEAMTSGVIAIDHDHRVINLNKAAERLLGTTISEARGRLLEEVTRAAELLQFVTRAMDTSTRKASAEEFTLTGTTPMTVRAIAEPMPQSDGLSGLLVLIEDVTHIRRLETLRSDFAANVSHELRTPITNLKGYVETLLEVGTTDETQSRRFLNVIKHNSDRLSAIVDDVMMLTELERPRADTSLEQEDTLLQTLIDEVVRQFQNSASAKKIVLLTEVEPKLSAVIHTRLIGQAVSNLVSNAINYSPASTTVTIRAESLGDDSVAISVADQGPGIPPAHRERLFERFYRADSARSRALGGTGLGLAIVKHITLAHGGTIDLESAIGRGSIFRIILPREGNTRPIR